MSTIAATVLVRITANGDDFTAVLAHELAALSRLHLAERLIIAPYGTSSEHEFQTVLTSPARLPRVVWELRTAFHPLVLLVAVGLGGLRSLPHRSGESIHEAGSGEAFDNARRASESFLAGRRTKLPSLTFVSGSDPLLDSVVNSIYQLHDTLLQQVTPRQWQVMLAVEREGRQDLAAATLGIDESTICRTLKRAHHRQLREARTALGKILECWQPRPGRMPDSG